MKSNTERILMVLHILAWIAFFGIIIKGGAILISYLISITNPQAATNLYKGLDLSAYRKHSFLLYTTIVAYKVAFYFTQAYIAFLITSLLSKLNIARPFSDDVVTLMKKISYSILCVWLIAMIYNLHIAIVERTNDLAASYISGDFIFLAGVIYVLAQMFKRGAEIQSENELTV